MSMSGYPVYRLNPDGNDPERVGSILEFRRSRRSMNRLGLARLAQKIFAQAPGDIIIVGSDTLMEHEGITALSGIAVTAG